jgi:hypothetical protein
MGTALRRESAGAGADAGDVSWGFSLFGVEACGKEGTG